MESARELRDLEVRGVRLNRSRMMSDFETFRPRDSSSISAASVSGSLTVRVFMKTV